VVMAAVAVAAAAPVAPAAVHAARSVVKSECFMALAQ
jgi:hypothetical protein